MSAHSETIMGIKIRNRVTRLIREDKQNFQQDLIEKFKLRPKLFFSYVRSKQTVEIGYSTYSARMAL